MRDQEHQANAVIVSTGAQSLMLGLEAESRLIGHGLSTCATCDGFFFRGHEIAVVGGGDSAVEEATFLTKFADKVTLIHRRDTLRASKIMQERAMANPKIEPLWNTTVVDLLGETKLEGARVRDVITGEERDPAGHRACSSPSATARTPTSFKGVLDMDDDGYLITRPGSTATNVDGVFACGDVQDHTYRQAITAAGSGCMAAIDAERWLEAAHHDAPWLGMAGAALGRASLRLVAGASLGACSWLRHSGMSAVRRLTPALASRAPKGPFAWLKASSP